MYLRPRLLAVCFLLFGGVGISSSQTAAPQLKSTPATFGARSVSVADDGSVWFIDARGSGPEGTVKRIVNSAVIDCMGSGVHLATGNGQVYAVNAEGHIFRGTCDAKGSQWIAMPGNATYIGARGSSVWVLDQRGTPHKWNGTNWVSVGGTAVVLDVDANGNPVVINSAHQIWRHNGQQWVLLPGAATDLSVSKSGNIYVVGGGNQIYRWKSSINNWEIVNGFKANHLAAAPNDNTFYVAGTPVTIVNFQTAPTGRVYQQEIAYDTASTAPTDTSTSSAPKVGITVTTTTPLDPNAPASAQPTTASVTPSNVAPSSLSTGPVLANSPIKLIHAGGYVAKFELGGYSSGDQTAGWTHTESYPMGKTVHVKVQEYTGLAWEPVRTIVDDDFSAPACIRVDGTTLDPKVHKDCQ